MPCRYDPTPEEIAASNVAVQNQQKARDAARKEALDKLTHENDLLREALLKYVDLYGVEDNIIDHSVWIQIDKSQIDHRKKDLARLKKTFTKSKDAARLGAVMLADPKKPLKEQLGFDPDEF